MIHTDALESLASLTAQFLPVGVQVLADEIFDYDRRTRGHVGYFDLKQLMEQLLDDTSYTAWIQAFDVSVVYWDTTPMNFSAFIPMYPDNGMFSMEGANGITHYIPGSSTQRDAAYHSMKWYQDAGLEKLGW